VVTLRAALFYSIKALLFSHNFLSFFSLSFFLSVALIHSPIHVSSFSRSLVIELTRCDLDDDDKIGSLPHQTECLVRSRVIAAAANG
jgi:hypothetical protein